LEQTDFFTVRFTVKRMCWDQVLRAASAKDLLIDQALGEQRLLGDDFDAHIRRDALTN
jgi:hypothetical protein